MDSYETKMFGDVKGWQMSMLKQIRDPLLHIQLLPTLLQPHHTEPYDKVYIHLMPSSQGCLLLHSSDKNKSI